jgi:hypothetical protein
MATTKKAPAAPAANPGSLTERAMLVNLSISYWTGKATDDSVVDELSKSHDSEKDVHDYRKRLVKAEAVNQFKAVRSRARAYHLEKTLPWIDGGTRVLPAPLYMEYMQKMRAFHNEYEVEIANFLRAYPGLKVEAKKRLGTLFKEGDYPDPIRLQRKFGWDLGVFPIPKKEDWRVDLGDKESAQMAKQVEERVKAAMEMATKDLWKRLYEVVKALAEKMAESDPKFRDSIIGNIRDLVGLLPQMNVVGDPKLEEMRRKVEEQLAKLSADELREDPKARKKTKDAADKLLEAMSGYIGNGS